MTRAFLGNLEFHGDKKKWLEAVALKASAPFIGPVDQGIFSHQRGGQIFLFIAMSFFNLLKGLFKFG